MSRDPYSPTWPWEPHEMAAIREVVSAEEPIALARAESDVPVRNSIVPSEQDYADARETLASLIREKVAPGLRAPTNDSIRQAYGLVIEAMYGEWAETNALREWAFGQLDRIITAVRGEPEPGWQHSLHDVAERVEQAMATRVAPPQRGARLAAEAREAAMEEAARAIEATPVNSSAWRGAYRAAARIVRSLGADQ